ncbi:MAG: hypothetical protein U9R48_01725 [Chloroflexota bacterium]|nr:hypothetical protein [Chloroflexota bacterium]
MADKDQLPPYMATVDRVTRAAITLIPFLLALVAFASTMAGTDFWGHLRFGLDMLETKRFIYSDPYSYLSIPGTWVNHEWLTEVIFALAYRAGDTWGLVALKFLIALGTLLILHRYVSRLQMPLLAHLGLLSLTVVGLMRAFATARPHMMTVPCFTLTVLILTRAVDRPRSLYLLIPIFIFWTNAHGGFMAGMAVVLLWAVSRSVVLVSRKAEGRAIPWRDLWHLWLPVALTVLATLINPYGPGLWSFLLRTATVPRPEITEWQPITVYRGFSLIYGTLLLFTAWGLLHRPTALAPSLRVVYLAVAALPLLAVRHLMLFAVAGPIITAPALAAACPPLSWTKRWTALTALILSLGISVALCVSFLQTPKAPRSRADDWAFPEDAVAFLAEADVEANLATPFNWGEYVLWHLGPEIQVSLDGRRETVYSEERYEVALALYTGKGEWDRLLRDWPTDLVLVERSTPAYNLMSLHPGWTCIYEDELAAIYGRRDGEFAGLSVAQR